MPVLPRLLCLLLLGLAACADVPTESLPAVALPSGMHCDRAALDAFTDRLLAEIGDVPAWVREIYEAG